MPVFESPDLPSVDVLTQTTVLSADNPPNASLPDVHTFGVNLLAEQIVSALATVHCMTVTCLIRADHILGGGFAPLAATSMSEELDMIYTDLIFPECISYGTTGSPEYSTDIVEVDNGAEQRNRRRDYPRHVYNVNMENMDALQTSAIMNIWHVCAGPHAAFLFMDPLDNTSLNTDDVLSGTDITSTDQFVATAVGSNSGYDLYKYYTYASRTARRRILYPNVDTLLVSVDGYDISSFTYNMSTCKLMFTLPLASLTASLSRSAGGAITGADFSALSAGDLVYITGFSDSNYNATVGGDPARVVSANATTLIVEKYDGTQYGSAVFTTETVTIKSALPPTGSIIRAGFMYYVPVRFEDDDNMESEIRSGMRESAFTVFGSIKLIEVMA